MSFKNTPYMSLTNLHTVGILVLAFSCATPKRVAETKTFRSAYKACHSFLIDDTLYHHSGKIFDLREFREIAKTKDATVLERHDGAQIYKSEGRLEINSRDAVDVLHD